MKPYNKRDKEIPSSKILRKDLAKDLEDEYTEHVRRNETYDIWSEYLFRVARVEDEKIKKKRGEREVYVIKTDENLSIEAMMELAIIR